MKTQTNPTIYTLAEKAGVSAATVSRALNNDKLINIKTRRQIQKMAEKEGYKKSPLARNLSLGRTGVIAALLPSINNPIYTYLAAKILERAQERNYSVFLNYSEDSMEREKKILNSFSNIQADGFIIFPSFSDRHEKCLKKLNRPVVIRGSVSGKCPFNAVWIDFHKGAYEATEYLIKQGQKNIRYMGFAGAVSCGDERPSGFIKAMSGNGMKSPYKNIIDTGFNIESAYRTALKFLSQTKPDALLIQSDYLAFGVLRAIGELKLRVPEDISIISFDNIEFSNYGTIPLTTMSQPFDEQAKLLVNTLLSRINNETLPVVHKKLDMKMILRSSVCKKIRNK